MTGTVKSEEIQELRAELGAHGQAHVLDYWDRLGPEEQRSLYGQIGQFLDGLESLVDRQRGAVEALGAMPPDDAIGPALGTIALPENGGDVGGFEAAARCGTEVLAAGRVGVIVVAGGQGTRLGFAGPKGDFPIGPVSERSLFALQAQKIRGLSRRIGRGIPWYVMTSEATDIETRQLFEAEDHFGLGRENIFIFSQAMLPAWDLEGRMLLESPGRISQSPDGHGGVYTAMRESGALEDMGSRGIDRIFYYQVDNPLVRIGDPVYLGFHEETGAEMSCKVIRKRDPMEKVGVVAARSGKPAMIEYTELADGQRFQRDEAGQLVYWAGNIAVHIFNLDFVDRIAQGSEGFLPLHASAKKITSLDRGGRPQVPAEPNGYKLERFVFDALPQAKGVCILEASAQEEFAPVKNAEGADSPATVRNRLTSQYGSWLEGTGIEMPSEAMAIEIDHAVIDSADEAETCGFASLAEAGDVIRVTTGMDS